MINTSVSLGNNRDFTLERAILLYRDAGNNTFATVHDPIAAPDGGAPLLGPGKPITRRVITALAKKLTPRLMPEVLPEHVICRTGDTIVWWRPAHTRLMHYTDSNTGGDYSLINGKVYPQPALVWMVRGSSLCVRALPTNERPTASTPLLIVPYWNVDARGVVCMGDMRRPTAPSVENLHEYENGFFGSAFTHPHANHIGYTTYPHRGSHNKPNPDGFFALWHSIRGKNSFPVHYLLDAQQNVAQFIAK